MVGVKRHYAVEALSGVHPAYRDCARFVLEYLDQKVPGVFADTCDRLFEMASEARSDVEQSRYFEGKREIEQRKSRLAHLYVERVDASLKDFFSHRRKASTEDNFAAFNEDDLRILDDRDLTVTLAIDSIVETADIRFTRELYGLGVRIGSIFETSPIPNDLNPLAPRALCEAFRDALLGLESEVEVHQALFKSFEKNVVRNLDEIYGALNQILVEAGVIPDLKTLRRKEKQRRPAPVHTPEQDERDTSDVVIDAAAAIERRLMEQVRKLISQQRPTRWSASQAAAPPIPTNTVMEVLSTLQNQLATGDAGRDVGAEDIKSQLMEVARNEGGRALGPGDENTVDMVGMMFDFVRADRQLPAPFQQALHRLQVPFLRAALKNPEAVLAPKAPARELLEVLGQLGMGWTTQTDRKGETLGTVNAAVDKVISEYWDDQQVLEKLRDELKTFHTRQQTLAEKRAERVRQQVKGKEQLQFARQNVARLLQRRVRNKPVPHLVSNLLNRAWAHVMVLTVLRHGMQSEQWRRVVATADELIWSVTFDKSEKAVKRLRTRIPILAKALRSGLKQVGYQDAEIQKVLINLKQLYVSMIRESGSDKIVIEADETGLTIRGENIVEQAVLDETPVAASEGELTEFFDTVRNWNTGQWVLFKRDENEPMRAKLSWISPITGHYLFVDQRGVKAAEKSLQELAEDLLAERLELMDESSLVTRAMHSIASNLGGRNKPEGAPLH
ncbi:MAG: DUF1631 domain-containing protein [Pseudomonadota bacterium]